MICDIVIVADIIVSFFADNYSEPGATINNGAIVYRYLSSYFIFDCLSSVPGLVTYERDNGDSYIYWLKLFRVA
jgi:hypothetical protein